ncbi:hypothetical protein ASPCADRAFT_3305 [Aspergillus carbonarius ITEM 5010]|uniref:NAD(P)-binding domain-containing protein n=1 Tax=Aspergillus carbonarius (strain ITEM 5010) TaxID=602072 RepID=A0A1R3RUU0_ASPC5|nr:hypothetical protein ASPCADRAFT_3305 [Aspergillus carbonarius ITEM 5010]
MPPPDPAPAPDSEPIRVPHVLLLGGNGRVARAMTKLLKAQSWKVTSVVRNPQQQKDHLLRLGAHEVIHHDLGNPHTVEDASHLIEKYQPSCVVFAAVDELVEKGVDSIEGEEDVERILKGTLLKA